MTSKNLTDIVTTLTLGSGVTLTAERKRLLEDEPMLAVAERFFDALRDEFDDLRRLADGDLGLRDLREMSLLGSPTNLRAFVGAYHGVAVDGSKTGSLEPVPNGDARMRSLSRQVAESMGLPDADGSFATGLSPERTSKAPGSKTQELCARDLPRRSESWSHQRPRIEIRASRRALSTRKGGALVRRVAATVGPDGIDST